MALHTIRVNFPPAALYLTIMQRHSKYEGMITRHARRSLPPGNTNEYKEIKRSLSEQSIQPIRLGMISVKFTSHLCIPHSE